MKPILLTPALGRAARAFLKWQQTDLAEAAHLSLATVNNFERESGEIRDSTLTAIQRAFEEHGIEFLSGGGLRRVDEIAEVTRFSGKNFINDWTYQIIRGGSESGGEILKSSYDEALWYDPRYLQSSKDFLAWVERSNIKLRTLISNEKNVLTPGHAYRAVPQEVIGKITYCLYGHKLALVLWKKKQVIVLHNAAVAETFRNQFNYLWRIGKPV
jgi:transcriptional regulator with XRE-family HTH domain